MSDAKAMQVPEAAGDALENADRCSYLHQVQKTCLSTGVVGAFFTLSLSK